MSEKEGKKWTIDFTKVLNTDTLRRMDYEKIENGKEREFVLDKTKYFGKTNKRYTTGLFLEFNRTEAIPIFSLMEDDIYIHSGPFEGNYLFSLHRLYMLESDPVEYNFAKKYFGSYEHWNSITMSNKFKKHIEALRMELNMKIKSEVVGSMLKVAKSEGAKGITAAKYIADGKYNDDLHKVIKDNEANEVNVIDFNEHFKLLNNEG